MTAAITTSGGRPGRLSPDHKAELDRIIAENPTDTLGQIRDRMFAATGRLMAKTTIWPHRPRQDGRKPKRLPGHGMGYRLGPPDRSGWFAELPARQRDALLRLMDAHPEKDAVEVVAMFAKEVAS